MENINGEYVYIANIYMYIYICTSVAVAAGLPDNECAVLTFDNGHGIRHNLIKILSEQVSALTEGGVHSLRRNTINDISHVMKRGGDDQPICLANSMLCSYMAMASSRRLFLTTPNMVGVMAFVTFV